MKNIRQIIVMLIAMTTVTTGYAQDVTTEDRPVDVGYGEVKKRDHTGVANGISGDELRRSGQTDLWRALQGRIPGLTITTGRFGESEVSIRGQNSLTLPQTPLFIVDGVVVESLDFVNIYDVDYVEVLKEGSIYGSRGANGAIIVHTKKN